MEDKLNINVIDEFNNLEHREVTQLENELYDVIQSAPFGASLELRVVKSHDKFDLELCLSSLKLDFQIRNSDENLIRSLRSLRNEAFSKIDEWKKNRFSNVDVDKASIVEMADHEVLKK